MKETYDSITDVIYLGREPGKVEIPMNTKDGDYLITIYDSDLYKDKEMSYKGEIQDTKIKYKLDSTDFGTFLKFWEMCRPIEKIIYSHGKNSYLLKSDQKVKSKLIKNLLKTKEDIDLNKNVELFLIGKDHVFTTMGATIYSNVIFDLKF